MNSLTKKAVAFALAIAAVAVIGWFGRKSYKHVTERRLLTEARSYSHDKDLRNAALCIQRALQINPMSVGAARMMAELAEEAGTPAALSWRIRVAQLKPTDMQFRLEWARTALRLQDYRSAADALTGVDEGGKATANYHKLEGQLDWSLNKSADAEKNYAEAARLEPGNEIIVLNLATIHLASTNSAVAGAARKTMLQFTTSTNTELRLGSLHLLAADADAHKAITKAVDYSSRLVKDPAATFRDRLAHLQLLKEAGRDDFDPWLASLQKEAKGSASSAFLLGEWMAKMEGPTAAKKWLLSLPDAIQTNQPVPLVIADCHAALKDWAGLLQLTGSEDWGEMNYYKLAMESLAHRGQGEDAAAANTWEKARRLATHRLDRLARLAQMAAVLKWNKEHAEVLDEVTTEFPKEKWAVDQLLAQFYAQGDTRAMQELLTRIQAANPSDPMLENNLANVLMLRNSDLDEAFRMAKECYERTPKDPFFASTYAYSLLLQKNSAEADRIFSTVNPKYLQIPVVAAYYGAVEAGAGHPDVARAALARAETAKLLPEEKEMVRLAKTRL